MLKHDRKEGYDTNNTCQYTAVDGFFKPDGKKGYDKINMYLSYLMHGFFSNTMGREGIIQMIRVIVAQWTVFLKTR